MVVMSKSGFCLMIRGGCHQGAVRCLLGEQTASFQEPWGRRRGGQRAWVTLDRDPICWMLHVYRSDKNSSREEAIFRKYLITVSVFVSPFNLAIKHAG